jgi:hypothetical protein
MKKILILFLIVLSSCNNSLQSERTEKYRITYQNGDTEVITVTFSGFNCRLNKGDFSCGNCGSALRSSVRSVEKLN